MVLPQRRHCQGKERERAQVEVSVRSNLMTTRMTGAKDESLKIGRVLALKDIGQTTSNICKLICDFEKVLMPLHWSEIRSFINSMCFYRKGGPECIEIHFVRSAKNPGKFQPRNCSSPCPVACVSQRK